MTHATDKRILMALTRFEIGGAETHVLELSLELQRMGYHVVVASNGGVYEKELEECGIKHIKVPMNKRSLPKMFVSYFKLKKIIKEERIDIVHAHARIPGFLCGLLKRKMNFTFVSTAHWVFSTQGGLKYLTNWGQKTVAVSDDIKEYLKDNYGVKEENIFVTINGIDTDKFSPDIDASSFEKEFGLKKGENRLVYVSRLDEDRAYAAELIINIAPKLSKEIDNGMTLYGPHRDDLRFLIEEDDIKIYGSQGQQKIAIISLKLSEIEIFKEMTNSSPIILLDDVFSELDVKNRNKLIGYINNGMQVIITSNDTRGVNRNFINESKIFKVIKGNIVEKVGNNNGKK